MAEPLAGGRASQAPPADKVLEPKVVKTLNQLLPKSRYPGSAGADRPISPPPAATGSQPPPARYPQPDVFAQQEARAAAVQRVALAKAAQRKENLEVEEQEAAVRQLAALERRHADRQRNQQFARENAQRKAVSAANNSAAPRASAQERALYSPRSVLAFGTRVQPSAPQSGQPRCDTAFRLCSHCLSSLRPCLTLWCCGHQAFETSAAEASEGCGGASAPASRATTGLI